MVYTLVIVVLACNIPLYRVSLSEDLVQASYRQKCKFTPEAVCCCLQTWL